MSAPLVSIVTPTLDRAELLRGCLDNVLAQTYPAIEHIVVDGGSTDGTLELLREYERDHGLRWISEPDNGVYDAVNKGLGLARGAVVAYLNNDDRYFPYSVEVAVGELLRSPELGFVYGDILRFDVRTRAGRVVFYPPFDAGYLRRGALIAQPTVFWRRSAGEGAGSFDDSLRLAADIEYWNRLSLSHPARHLEEVLAYESEHDERLTSGEAARATSRVELQRIRERYADELPGGPIQRVRDRARAAFWFRLAALRFAWNLRRTRSGRAGIRWSAFRADPRDLRISRSRLFVAMLPFAGRRYPDFVAVPPDLLR